MAVLQNYFSKKNSVVIDNMQTFIIYNTCILGLSSLFSLTMSCFINKQFSINFIIGAVSLLSAISIAGGTLFAFLALKKGSVVLVNVFCASGILIPCVASIFLFEEDFAIHQIFGVALLISSLYLIIGHNQTVRGKITLKCLMFSMLAMTFNGLQMLSLKLFTYYMPDGNISMFLFFAFGGASLITLSALLFIKSIQLNIKKTNSYTNWLVFSVISVAALGIGCNYLLTLAGLDIPSVLLFPMYSGVSLIITAIISAICFKEAITKKCVLGLACGIIALISMNL